MTRAWTASLAFIKATLAIHHWFMRAFKVVIAVTGLVAIGAAIFLYYSSPDRWLAYTRENSIQALTAAENHQQLEEAVKPNGVLVYAKDGSWVAIRYRDTHYLSPIQSLAIAKDSGGRWFSCERHFCGWLTSFARERTRIEDPNALEEMFPPSPGSRGQVGYERMEALFSSADLGALRASLKQMGFQEISVE